MLPLLQPVRLGGTSQQKHHRSEQPSPPLERQPLLCTAGGSPCVAGQMQRNRRKDDGAKGSSVTRTDAVE